MIRLSKLNGREFVLNSDLIETIEETPDTVISLVNGKKYVVKESIEKIVEKMIQYKRKIYLTCPSDLQLTQKEKGF